MNMSAARGIVEAATIDDTPMIFAQYAAWEAEALTKVDRLKTEIAILDEQIKVAESRVWVDVVELADRQNRKPPTLDAINAASKVHPARLALVEARNTASMGLLEAEAEARGFTVVVVALQMRSAHLVARAVVQR